MLCYKKMFMKSNHMLYCDQAFVKDGSNKVPEAKN